MFIWKETSHWSSLFRLDQAYLQSQSTKFLLVLLIIAVLGHLSCIVFMLLSNRLLRFSDCKSLECLRMQLANIICKQLVFCCRCLCPSSAKNPSLFWSIGFYSL